MLVVTGGAGFIGSNLVAALAEQGHEVVVCDLLGSGDKWRNLAKHELVDLIPPVALFSFLDANVNRIDAIFHMGAISATTETDADAIVQSNIRATFDLVHWCQRHGKRLIYASSAATYGDGSQGFDDDFSPEALARLRPLNAYGWSKHVVDRRLARLRSQGKPLPMQCVGLKFFNVYGPNEFHKGDMQSLVCKAYPALVAGKPVRLFRSHHPEYPDGGQLRDFIYVRDVVDVMLWLYASPHVSGLFNVGTGKARSFADLVAALGKAAGVEPRIEFIDTPESIRAKYQYFTQARMDRLRAAGYDRPFTSLEEGVRDYVVNYLSTSDPYR